MHWTCLLTVLVLASPSFALQKPVKDGFYRIKNKDGGYLTATREQGTNQDVLLSKCTSAGETSGELDTKHRLPKRVIVSEWKSLPTQEWKVKTNEKEGSPLQIIRNEKVRDNEVSKRVNEQEGSAQESFVPIDFNLENPNEEGYLQITDGLGCLESQGVGKEIILECDCDANLSNQHWKFEFLFEIPKPQH